MQSLWNSLEATLTQLRVTFLQSDSSADDDDDEGHGYKRDKDKGGDRKRSAKEAADKDKEVSGCETLHASFLVLYLTTYIDTEEQQGRVVSSRWSERPAPDCFTIRSESPAASD